MTIHPNKHFMSTSSVRSILFAAFFLFIAGCRALVEDEFLPFADQPVVNCIMKEGDPIVFNLSYTGAIDNSNLLFIENAEITLFEDSVLKASISHSDHGNYVSNIIAASQKNYSFEISIPGINAITGFQSMPERDSIYEIVGNVNGYKDEEGTWHPSVTFSFRNDPSEIKYYHVLLHKIGDEADIILDPVKITDPVLLAEGQPLTIFSTQSIETDSYSMTINYRRGYIEPLVIEFRSVTYDYYQFVKQRFQYESGRYPSFVGGTVTAFPIYSNLEGGDGIFAGYTPYVTETSINF